MNIWQAWRAHRALKRAERVAIHPQWWVRAWMRWESRRGEVKSPWAGVIGGSVISLCVGSVAALVVAIAMDKNGCADLIPWLLVPIMLIVLAGASCPFWIGGINNRGRQSVIKSLERLRDVHDSAFQGGELTEVE